jgi:hypothetical protein
MAFAQAYDYLKTNVSQHEANWRWANVHSNSYANLPWSRTPLKLIFHREVPTFGNSNTPHVSKISYGKSIETMRFSSSHVAGYKMIIAHEETAKKGVNLYSIDTGVNGNLFAGNYFNMNKNHLAGKLAPMLIGD